MQFAQGVGKALSALAKGIQSILGQEHKYADVLTRPNQGAQWILEHQTLPAIYAWITELEDTGTASTADYSQAVDALIDARDQFFNYLNRSGLINRAAGQQAHADFTALFNGGQAWGEQLSGLIPDMEKKMRDAQMGGVDWQRLIGEGLDFVDEQFFDDRYIVNTPGGMVITDTRRIQQTLAPEAWPSWVWLAIGVGALIVVPRLLK